MTGSGTYEVKGLVKFDVAPGTFPLKFDNIGNPLDIGCSNPGIAADHENPRLATRGVADAKKHEACPDNVFEGITASKGNVDYWNRELAPDNPPGNTDRTAFHVVPEAEN
jgi:hypothetical protein